MPEAAKAAKAAKAAVEALGGTPAGIVRRTWSPVRFVLPPPLSRFVGRADRAADEVFDRFLRGRPGADRLFYAASSLGDYSLLWHLIGTARALRSERDERAAVRLAVALAVESALVNGAIKSLFRRARPPWEQHRPLRLRQPRTSSFPSGHASSGFMAASLLADGAATAGLAWHALAAVVAASRVHVRIHHASDVVAGAAMGLAFGHIMRRVWPIPVRAMSQRGDEDSAHRG